MPSATLELTCLGCEYEGDEIPKAAKPRAAPAEAVGGGPRDWRVSFAGLVGLTGVICGEGEGEGER